MTDLEKAKQCAAWILSNCAAKYVSPEVFSSNPQVVIDNMIEAAAEKVAAYASHSNSELTEEIANLRAEDNGDLRIHDKLQLAENVIQTWTTRAETAEHANSELLERVQKLEQAHRDILNERDTALDMMRCEFTRGTYENDAWHKGVYEAWRTFNNVKDISRKALAKAPETRNV